MLGRFTPRERGTLFAGAARLARGALYGEGAQSPLAEGDTHATALHGLYWLTVAVTDRGPTVLTVDDAHWADPSSLRFMGYLAARVDELPVGVVTKPFEAATPGRRAEPWPKSPRTRGRSACNPPR